MPGRKGQMGVSTCHVANPMSAGVVDGSSLDQLAIALPALGDPPDPTGGPVRHVLLNEIKEAAGNFGQPGIAGREGVELVSVQNQNLDRFVAKDIFVQDLNAHDMADDVSRAVVIATYPDQVEIVAIGIAPDDLQAREMPLGKSLEIQIVEDIPIDHQLIAVLDCPK